MFKRTFHLYKHLLVSLRKRSDNSGLRLIVRKHTSSRKCEFESKIQSTQQRCFFPFHFARASTSYLPQMCVYMCIHDTHLHLHMPVAYVWRFHYNMLWTLCSNCLDEKLRSITCCVTKDVLVFQLLSSVPQNTSDDDNQFAGLLWDWMKRNQIPATWHVESANHCDCEGLGYGVLWMNPRPTIYHLCDTGPVNSSICASLAPFSKVEIQCLHHRGC